MVREPRRKLSLFCGNEAEIPFRDLPLKGIHSPKSQTSFMENKILVFIFNEMIYSGFMKSYFLFGFLTLISSFFSCFPARVEVPPVSKNGNWPVINIEEMILDSSGIVISASSKNYNPGEKAFEFDESALLYQEYDNGVITRSGNYINGNSPNEFVMLSGQDSVKLKIQGQGPWDLVLETVERSGSNTILRNVSGNRDY